ncbi:MAG: Hsp20/alpha crystallin family protein [Candidatus Diapherotrites archaeon]
MKEPDFWSEMRSFDPFYDFRIPSIDVKMPHVRTPLIDVVDKGKHFEVVCELPGVEKEDIKINVFEEAISIGAEQKHNFKIEKKEQGFFRRERSHNRFFRQLPFPSPVKPETAIAEYKNGILTVTVEKRKAERKEHKGQEVKVK